MDEFFLFAKKLTIPFFFVSSIVYIILHALSKSRQSYYSIQPLIPIPTVIYIQGENVILLYINIIIMGYLYLPFY